MQAQIDAADSRAVNLLTELSKLQSRLDDQTLAHKRASDEQAANHQKSLDEQAANHQKALDEQAGHHAKTLVQSSAQIERLKEQVDDLKIELKKATGQAPKSERNRGEPGTGSPNGGDGGDGGGNQPDDPERERTNKEIYDSGQ